MSEPFVAEIRPWACGFAPRGWAACDGQLMAISQNTVLFSVIGTTYGGDGKATFALPDLQGRAPVGVGAGPGLTDRRLGEIGGETTVTLTAAQLPEHTHGLEASSLRADAAAPSAASVMATASGPVYATGTADATLAPEAVNQVQGGGGPHNNLMPYQVVNFCIALVGIFPNRP